MANHTYQNIDLSTVCIDTPFTQDEIIVATGAGTIAAGTLLGRVTASGKLLATATGAVDGSETPVSVLQYDIEAAGAGDLPCRPVLKGSVRADKCFLAATPSTALTPAQKDALRTMGILAVEVDELGKFNNPGA